MPWKSKSKIQRLWKRMRGRERGGITMLPDWLLILMGYGKWVDAGVQHDADYSRVTSPEERLVADQKLRVFLLNAADYYAARGKKHKARRTRVFAEVAYQAVREYGMEYGDFDFAED